MQQDRPENSQVNREADRVLGACWNFYDIAGTASQLESLVEVMAGASSGRCWLELYSY